MAEIAKQMSIWENRVYKHKRNTLLISSKRMKHETNNRNSLLNVHTALKLINGEEISAIVIDFYRGYIYKISELLITDSEINAEVKNFDKDLMQNGSHPEIADICVY